MLLLSKYFFNKKLFYIYFNKISIKQWETFLYIQKTPHSNIRIFYYLTMSNYVNMNYVYFSFSKIFNKTTLIPLSIALKHKINFIFLINLTLSKNKIFEIKFWTIWNTKNNFFLIINNNIAKIPMNMLMKVRLKCYIITQKIFFSQKNKFNNINLIETLLHIFWISKFKQIFLLK